MIILFCQASGQTKCPNTWPAWQLHCCSFSFISGFPQMGCNSWMVKNGKSKKLLSSSDPHLKHYSGIVSDIPSGSIYGIFILAFYLTFFLAYTLTYFDILSDIQSGIYFDILSDIIFAILSGIYSGIHLTFSPASG